MRAELRAMSPAGSGNSFILIASDKDDGFLQSAEGDGRNLQAMIANLLATKSLSPLVGEAIKSVLGLANERWAELNGTEEGLSDETEETDYDDEAVCPGN